MGQSTLRHLLRALAVTLLGPSGCSAIVRVLKTNAHCIIANGNAICPGDEYRFGSDFVTIAAGFPDNSKALKEWTPYWEETLWIGSHSILELPGFDKSMKNIFFGEDSCLYGNVGFGTITVNAQLIKCINQRYVGQPYPNPWATKNYGPLVEQAVLDFPIPSHNHNGESPMDYRALPRQEGDPNNELPAYNGFNPLLQGKHQDSQWGTGNVDYPSSQPPIYDTTGPPLSYPVKKIRPIRPYPAPGVPVENMPNIYDLPSFLPSCPKYKPNCNKRKTPGQIRKEGSVASPNTNVAMTDSSTEPTPGATDSSDSAAATATTIDGTAAAGGGDTITTTASTDTESGNTSITVPAAGTTGILTGGTSMALIDGTAAAPTYGITTSSTDTTVASLPGIDTTTTTANTDNQDLTAQTVPSDSTLFGKKSRRAFPHPRDFSVQMR